MFLTAIRTQPHPSCRSLRDILNLFGNTSVFWMVLVSHVSVLSTMSKFVVFNRDSTLATLFLMLWKLEFNTRSPFILFSFTGVVLRAGEEDVNGGPGLNTE